MEKIRNGVELITHRKLVWNGNWSVYDWTSWNVLIQFTNTSRKLPRTVCRESQSNHSHHSIHNPWETDNKFILHTTTQFVFQALSCLIIACAICFPSSQSS